MRSFTRVVSRARDGWFLEGYAGISVSRLVFQLKRRATGAAGVRPDSPVGVRN